MDLKCKKCGRWLGHTDTDCDTVIKCGNCKENNHFVARFQSSFKNGTPCRDTIKNNKEEN